MSCYPNIRAATGRLRRVYSVTIMGPGCHFEVWPSLSYRSNARIRAFTMDFFRRWFGRSPDGLCWHKDGFMAEANCRRGFCVQVEQINYAVQRPVWAPRYRNSRALWLVPGKERVA